MNLPNYLFWDTDLKSLNFKDHARFIIQRVIQKGSISDWKTIKAYYGLEFIKNEILQIRDLDPITLNFFSTYFGVQKKDFRCFTTQQSIPKLYN